MEAQELFSRETLDSLMSKVKEGKAKTLKRTGFVDSSNGIEWEILSVESMGNVVTMKVRPAAGVRIRKSYFIAFEKDTLKIKLHSK